MKTKLNTLKNIPFEQWPSHGVRLQAVSANGDGIVNSGITSCGTYFFRKWTKNFETSEFEIEN